MAQWVKALTAKLADLSLIPRTQTVAGRINSVNLYSDLHMHSGKHIHICMHAHTNKCNKNL